MGATRDSTPSQEGQMALPRGLTSLHQPPGPPPGSTAPTLPGSLFSGLEEDISERGRQGLVQVPHSHSSEPSASVGCWAVLTGGG